MLKIQFFNFKDNFLAETAPFEEKALNWHIQEATQQINNNPEAAGWRVFTSLGPMSLGSWLHYKPNSAETSYDKRLQGTPSERINTLIESIKCYNDEPDKYSFDFAQVEQLLHIAVNVMNNTAIGIRPKDLPADIPWSERLSHGADDEDFNAYAYDGTMSAEDYDKMRDNYERDLHSVVVYQSPDGKHCALQRQDNYGIPDETTDAVGKRYVLPKGIRVPADCNRYHQLQNDDDPDQEVFIDNNQNGVPAIHLVYKDSGESYQDIIPLREYEGAELSQQYPLTEQEKQYDKTVMKNDDSLTNKLSLAYQAANLQNQGTQKTSPEMSI
jgi:hypothetical protein